MEIIIYFIILLIFSLLFYFWHSEENSIFEKYIVKYLDGKESIPMNYKNALSYAEIFKGKIIRI